MHNVVDVYAPVVCVEKQYDMGNLGGWDAFNMIFDVTAFLV